MIRHVVTRNAKDASRIAAIRGTLDVGRHRAPHLAATEVVGPWMTDRSAADREA